jgi:hypothetical protein
VGEREGEGGSEREVWRRVVGGRMGGREEGGGIRERVSERERETLV